MVSVSIKSEIDSRVILYPLMKCLVPLGNCLVVTSNKQVSRLIDMEYDGEFRNFRILVDLEGATDELLDSANISADEYTFVVYDNVGIVDQDKLIIPIGPITSDVFNSEMMYLGEDINTHIIKFGKSIKKNIKNIKSEKEISNKSKKHDKSNDMTDEEVYEESVKTFKPKKVDVAATLKKLPNLNFPNFDDIERLEGNKQFFNIDRNFVKLFYTIFQSYIGVKEVNFMKEVSKKDEGSCNIR